MGKKKTGTKRGNGTGKAATATSEPTVEELRKQQEAAEKKRLEQCRAEVDAALKRHHCELRAEPSASLLEAPDGGVMVSWHARIGIVPARTE